jgi:hypothetical protein
MPEHSPLPWIIGCWHSEIVPGLGHVWKFGYRGDWPSIHHAVNLGDTRPYGQRPGNTSVVDVYEEDLVLSLEDAQHIVKCVNLHDELVKSLDDASWYISQCEDGGSAGARKLHDHVRALLAKAKGET